MQSEFIDRFNIEEKHQNSDTTILRDKTTQQLILMREIPVFTHKNYKNMVETLQVQKQLKHPNLLSLIDYQFVLERISEAGPQRKVMCYFEYSKYRLDVQIGMRQQYQQHFQESQLWSMLISLVKALSYLQFQDIGHSGISSASIMICQKTGDIKIMDPAMSSISSFQLSYDTFYSPELLRAHINNGNIDQINIFKSDVFCLGMVLLEASLLQNCCDCYLYDKGILNKHLLKSKRIQIRQYYSEQFCNVIQIMLKTNPQDRPDFLQLEELLKELGVNGDLPSFISHKSFSKAQQYIMNHNIHQENIHQNLNAMNSDIEDKANSKYLGLSSSPDTQLCIDVQTDLKINIEQLQSRTLLRQSSRSLMKIGSCESLPSPRSVQSKQLQPTAVRGSQYAFQCSVNDFSLLKGKNEFSIDTIQNKQNSSLVCNFSDKNIIGWHNYVYNPSPNQIYTDPLLAQLIKQQLNKPKENKQIYYK